MQRLKAENFSVDWAPDATLGVQQVYRVQPDLIILDMMLPGGGGLGVLDRIASWIEARRVPVVVLTGLNSEEIKKAALAKGVIAYFRKPYDMRQLSDDLKGILLRSQPPGRKGRHILVVDDDEDVIRMIEMRLKAEGFRVTLARDGQEAFNRIQQDRPDLIISDLLMPKVDGWQLSFKLKKHEVLSKIPVIFLSVLVDQEGPYPDMEVGDYYLPKPFQGEKLLEKVSALLQHPSR